MLSSINTELNFKITIIYVGFYSVIMILPMKCMLISLLLYQ